MSETNEMQEYSRMMARKYPKQNAFAIRNMLNQMAAVSRQQAVTKGTAEFTKRNKYINKTIQFQKVRGRTDIDSMESMFGQVSKMFGKPAGQLSIQETGGVLNPKSGSNLRIGTKGARPGKSYRKPVRRAAAKKKFLTPKKFFKNSPHKPHTSRGQSIGLIAWAKRNKFPGLIQMESPQKKKYGAFRVTGSGKKARFNMVFNLEKKSQKIEATHWMEKSYKGVVERRDKIFNHYLEKEMIRLKRETGL